MKAVVYARVSTDKQRDKQSIETQLDFARRYADLHQIEITEIYKDDGVSGGVRFRERPEGARLLADAQDGKFTLLLIYRVDRLGRSLFDLLDTHYLLEGMGVSFRSMTEPIDTATATGKFVFQMIGGMAELEKANIRERSMDASERLAREGKWLGGMAPLGYKVVPDEQDAKRCRLAVDPEEAQLVDRIFTLYLEEQMPVAEIANLLNAEDILPRNTAREKGPKGKGWHGTTVHKILKNRTYLGENLYNKRRAVRRNGQVVGQELTPPDERVMRPTPPLIDPETFAAVQRRLRENNDRPSNARREYLLRGLMRCGLCGAVYGGVSPSNRHVFYYKCVRYMSPNDNHRCPSALVRGDLLEADVWADIVEFAHNPGKVIEQLQAQIEAQAKQLIPVQIEQDVIRQNVQRLQAERARVIGLVRKALISDSEAESELTQLQQEIQVLESRFASLQERQQRAGELRAKLADTDTLLLRLAEAVEDASPQKKRQVIKLLVDGIQVETVLENGKKVPHFHVTYSFDAGPEGLERINGIPHGSPLTIVTPLSASPDDSWVAASRP